jgi:hypothetical protein
MTNGPVHSNEDHVVMTNEDDANLERINAHVNAITAGAQSRRYVLNTALGHHLPLPPLTDADINANITAMCASFYAETSSEDDTEAIIADALNYAGTSSDDDTDARIAHGRTAHRPQTPYYVPASPASPAHVSNFTRDDITYNLSDVLSHASLGSSRPSAPMPTSILPTVPVESRSSSVVIPPLSSAVHSGAPSPQRPRKLRRYEWPQPAFADRNRSVRPRPTPAPANAPLPDPPQWGDAPLHAEPRTMASVPMGGRS